MPIGGGGFGEGGFGEQGFGAPPSGLIGPIQSAIAGPSPNNSFTLQFTLNVAAGDLLVVEVFAVWSTGTAAVFTVSDDQGNVYTRDAHDGGASSLAPYGVNAAIYRAVASSGGVRPTVTAAIANVTVLYAGLGIAEYPTAALSPFDSATSSFDNGTNGYAAASLRAATNNELVIALGVGGGFTGPGWTSRNVWPGSSYSADGQDQQVNASTTVAASETNSTGIQASVILLVAYKFSAVVAISFGAVMLPSAGMRSASQSVQPGASLPLAACSRLAAGTRSTGASVSSGSGSPAYQAGKTASGIVVSNRGSASYLRIVNFLVNAAIAPFVAARSVFGSRATAAIQSAASASSSRSTARGLAASIAALAGATARKIPVGITASLSQLQASLSRAGSSSVQIFMAVLSQDTTMSTRSVGKAQAAALHPDAAKLGQQVAKAPSLSLSPSTAGSSRIRSGALSAILSPVSSALDRLKSQPISFAGFLIGFRGSTANQAEKQVPSRTLPEAGSASKSSARSSAAVLLPAFTLIRRSWLGRIAGRLREFVGQVLTTASHLPGRPRVMVILAASPRLSASIEAVSRTEPIYAESRLIMIVNP